MAYDDAFTRRITRAGRLLIVSFTFQTFTFKLMALGVLLPVIAWWRFRFLLPAPIANSCHNPSPFFNRLAERSDI